MGKVRGEIGVRLSRRAVLQAAAVTGVGAPLVLRGIGSARAATPLKLTWNANAICTVSVPVAAQRGHFEKHGLKVELINFGGSTDQLLEAIATGKADAGVGMALRWLKPLEQGFDVKLTAGIHGGCMRLLGSKAAGITDLKSLRGKTVAVSDMAAPDKNFLSILLQQQGIDPIKEVEWRQYPADLLGLAVKKGEAQALAAGDPIAWLTQRKFDLVEVATNLIGEYQHRSCCVLGVRGSLIKQDRAAATALTRALLEAGNWTAHHQQLDQPGIHRLLSSEDILGGLGTVTSVFIAAKVWETNPKVYRAVLEGLRDALALIARDKALAARLFVEEEKSSLTADYIRGVLEKSGTRYSAVPVNTAKFGDFMFRTGALKTRPGKWQDYFFPEIHDQPGS